MAARKDSWIYRSGSGRLMGTVLPVDRFVQRTEYDCLLPAPTLARPVRTRDRIRWVY